MDSSNYFTITLSSSDTSDPHNSLANFKTILGKEKILDGKWVVGLSEMHYTKSWYNIYHDFMVSVEDGNGGTFTCPQKVEAGFYESEAALVNAINQSVGSCLPAITESAKRTRSQSVVDVTLPKIEYAQRARRMSNKSGIGPNEVKLFLLLPFEIEEMLGLSRTDDAYTLEQSEQDYTIEDNHIEVLPKKQKKRKTKIKFVSEVIKGEVDAYK